MKLKHLFFTYFLITISIVSCSKSDENITVDGNLIEQPNSNGTIIKTVSVVNITQVKAVCNCNIVSNTDAPFTMTGICWGTMPTPTLNSCWNQYDYYNKMSYDGNLSGTYSSLAKILYPNTTYYVRAYALNAKDTVYGNVISFKTLPVAPFGTVMDCEGTIYKTIKIGNQTWMAENLKTTKYNDGTKIDYMPTDNNLLFLEKGYYCEYNRTFINANVYGRLYNGYVVAKNICPTGWHIPSQAERNELYKFLGYNYYNTYGDSSNTSNAISAAKALAAVSTLWSTPNDVTVGNPIEMNNTTGFSAIPSGYYSYSSKKFTRKDTVAEYWTSTKTSYYEHITMELDSRSSCLGTNAMNVSSFGAIRCIKD